MLRSDGSKNGGVRFGPIETKEVPRTLRKDTSLEQYAPTPPTSKKRKKKGLLSRGRRQGSSSFERDYEISAKYALMAKQQQQQQQPAVNHTYEPSPRSGRRRSDERRQVR